MTRTATSTDAPRSDTPNAPLPTPILAPPGAVPDESPIPALRRPRKPAKQAARRVSYGAVRRLPSNRWQARFTDADGTRRPAPMTFATKRDADDWITTHKADHIRGAWRSPEIGARPFAAYAHDYLAARVDLAPRTLDGYQRLLANWIEPTLTHPSGRPVTLGSTNLSDLSPIQIRDWYAAALSEARRRAITHLEAQDRRRATRARHAAREWALNAGLPVKRTGRLPASVLEAWRDSGAPGAATLDLPPSEPSADAGRVQTARAYQLVRSILACAHRDGLIVANPCAIRGAGSVKAAERPHATPAEIARIAAWMPPRYAAAVQVAAWSGLRAGELFALTRAHVDLDRGTVRVERALVEIPGQPLRFGPPKTTASRRTVHLPAPVVTLLREHLTTYTASGPDALVFARSNGRPIRAAHRTRMFRDACAREGLHQLHWHDLRHTGATIAAQSGASLRELQARLGHSTVAAAMTYQHATAERDRDLADRMAALIPDTAVPQRRLRAVD